MIKLHEIPDQGLRQNLNSLTAEAEIKAMVDPWALPVKSKSRSTLYKSTTRIEKLIVHVMSRIVKTTWIPNDCKNKTKIVKR